MSSSIPVSVEMMALKRLPKEAFGIMISMEPAVAALLAYELLAEVLSPQQWLAIGCIVAASMGSTLHGALLRLLDGVAIWRCRPAIP